MPGYRNARRTRTRKKREAMKGYLILGGFVLSLAVLVFCAGKLIRIARSYRASKETYRSVAELYAPETGPVYAPTDAPPAPIAASSPDPVLSGSPEARPAAATPLPEPRAEENSGDEDPETVTLPFRIDWDSLLEENPDTVGWLYSEGTPVHYPVVRGSDNSYYLTHDFYGNDSAGGALFLDVRNELSSEIDHLMIYGHRMKDDSMFGSVADYAEERYYRKHPVLYFLTPEQSWRAEVIGCRTVHAEEKYFPPLFESEQAYAAYLKKLRSQRYYETEADPDTRFRLLTLVTCSTYTHGGDVRLLIHARLVPVRPVW